MNQPPSKLQTDYGVWILQPSTRLLLAKLKQMRDTLLSEAENVADDRLSREKLIKSRAYKDLIEIISDESKLQLK